MAITRVGWGTVAAAASGNVTPGLPTNIAADDLLICIVHSSDQVSHSMDAAWTQIVQGNGGGTTSRLSVWRHKYDGSTDPSRVVTHASGQSPIARIVAFRGVDTTTAVDVAGTILTGTDATMEFNAVTIVTDYAVALAITGSADDNARTLQADSGVAIGEGVQWGNVTTAGTPDGSISCFYRPVAAGSYTAATITQAASDAWASVCIALRPAASSRVIQAVPFHLHNGTTITVNFHKPPASGNSIIVCVSQIDSNGNGTVVVSDSEGNSYAADASQGSTNGGDSGLAAIWSSHAITVSGAASVTINPGGANTYATGIILEVAGLAASPKDKTGTNSATTTTDANVTASGANTQNAEFVVACTNFLGANSAVAYTGPTTGYQPANFWEDQNVAVAGHGAFKEINGAETSAATWSHSNTSQASWSAVIVTYKIAGNGSVGSASGAGSVAAAGKSTARSTGAESGSGTQAATGKSTARSTGAASGTGTMAAAGRGKVIGVGAAAGAGTQAATGKSTARGVGAETGAGTQSGTGRSTARSAGAAAGTGTETGTGRATARSAAAASGAGTQTGTGKSTARAASAASGAGTQAATGRATRRGVGTQSGAGTQAGTGKSTARVAAAASGTGTAAAQSTAAGSVGIAAGTGTVTGSGRSTARAVGAASGAGATSGVGAAISRAAATASGAGAATATGREVRQPQQPQLIYGLNRILAQGRIRDAEDEEEEKRREDEAREKKARLDRDIHVRGAGAATGLCRLALSAPRTAFGRGMAGGAIAMDLPADRAARGRGASAGEVRPGLVAARGVWHLHDHEIAALMAAA
jgi:hypothetical protein